jgi:hypothetical protein
MGVPLASGNSSAYIEAYDSAIKLCAKRNEKPDFVRLDNASSKALEDHLTKLKVGYQYVPAGNHRANRAERAIRTWKNHFIAGLSSVHPQFDLALWDQLLPQCNLTLNLLRGSSINPSISAYEQMYGPYDFAAHPIHSPGCQVVSWMEPTKRGPFSAHGDVGYYLGPAFDHYRSFRVWIPTTRATRVTASLSWHPFNPLLSTEFVKEDVLVDAISHLSSSVNAYLASLPNRATSQRNLPSDPPLPILLHTLRAIYGEDGSNAPPSIAQALSYLREASDISNSVPNDLSIPTAETTPTQRVPAPMTSDTFNVERIIKHRKTGERMQFRVHWEGYPDSADSWEPLDNVIGCQAYLDYATIHPTILPLAAVPLHVDMTGGDITSKTRRVRKPNHVAASVTPALLANAVNYHPITGAPLKWASVMAGQEKAQWEAAMDSEFVKLFTTYDVMHLIRWRDVPPHRLVSYFTVALRIKQTPSGELTMRARGTYGGTSSDWEGEKSAHTAGMPTVKLLLNHVVSNPLAKFASLDITDMYLHTRLERMEYMMIPLKYFPPATIARYHILDFVEEGKDYVVVEVTAGLYGLPQAGMLAQEKLVTHLSANGYSVCPNTTCLFKHIDSNTWFTLVVDDFGVSYESIADAQRLIDVLEQVYPMKVDWSGSSYLGLTIADTGSGTDRTMSISMPSYVPNALRRFGVTLQRPVMSPEKYSALPHYDPASRYTVDDMSPLLTDDKKKLCQQIIGVMAYYARIIDGTMLGAVNRLASKQATATQETLDACYHLLQYAATYPSCSVVYRPSDMILWMDSDASYNSETGARSRGSYCAWLGSTTDPGTNGFVEVNSSIIPTVVCAASEAEYAALYQAGKGGVQLRRTLSDLLHAQPPTIIHTDNSTAKGIASTTCKMKRSHAIDMRYHWIKEQQEQGEYDVRWHPGVEALADLTTKVQPPSAMLKLRGRYVTDNAPSANT